VNFNCFQDILNGVKLTINLISGWEETHQEGAQSPGVQSPEQYSGPPLEVAVGDLVTCHTTNPPRLAEVVELGNNSSVVVFIRLLGTGLINPSSVSTTSISPPPITTSEEWEVGESVQAVSPSINSWADAIVEQVGTQAVQVKFLAGKMTGDLEWLPFPRLHKSSNLPTSSRGKDDELKRVGKPHRQQFKQDKKRSQNQQAWQQFSQKNKRARKSTEDSIFRSPETEKGKVGVTGSDKDLTPRIDLPKNTNKK